jgi:hypothetical protein
MLGPIGTATASCAPRSPLTGLLPYAAQIRRQYDATQAHSDYGTYLPQRLRQLLAALEAA